MSLTNRSTVQRSRADYRVISVKHKLKLLLQQENASRSQRWMQLDGCDLGYKNTPLQMHYTSGE